MKAPTPSNRAVVALAWLAGLAALALGAWLVGQVVTLAEENQHLAERSERAADDSADLRQEVRGMQTVTEALAEQVRQLGEDPIIEPDTPTEPGEVIVIPGPPGLDGQDGARGRTGRPGAPGEDGGRGAAGADGTDGAEGPQGPQGPQGPPGPEGPQGPQGPQGEPGPAADLSAYATRDWVIALIQALGCEVSSGDAPAFLFTCSVTGKP